MANPTEERPAVGHSSSTRVYLFTYLICIIAYKFRGVSTTSRHQRECCNRRGSGLPRLAYERNRRVLATVVITHAIKRQRVSSGAGLPVRSAGPRRTCSSRMKLFGTV